MVPRPHREHFPFKPLSTKEFLHKNPSTEPVIQTGTLVLGRAATVETLLVFNYVRAAVEIPFSPIVFG